MLFDAAAIAAEQSYAMNRPKDDSTTRGRSSATYPAGRRHDRCWRRSSSKAITRWNAITTLPGSPPAASTSVLIDAKTCHPPPPDLAAPDPFVVGG